MHICRNSCSKYSIGLITVLLVSTFCRIILDKALGRFCTFGCTNVLQKSFMNNFHLFRMWAPANYLCFVTSK